jgi:hypothetical protein
MRTLILALCLFLPVTQALSQNEASGVIFGLLSDNVAHLVSNAPIEARNVATGAEYNVTSGPVGQYRITGLPAGDYRVTVHINLIGDFPQSTIKVADAGPTRLDIVLPLP